MKINLIKIVGMPVSLAIPPLTPYIALSSDAVFIFLIMPSPS